MMNEHERARGIITRWTEGQSIDEGDLAFLEGHESACAVCGNEFQGLLPLLRVDAGLAASVLAASDIADAGFGDRVMAAIDTAPSPSGRFAIFRAGPGKGRLASLVLPLAAAAILALALILPLRGGSDAVAASAKATEDTVTLNFVIAAPLATTVALAGDFTDWKTEGYELDPRGDGTWAISIPLERGRLYSYNFVIDGARWILDPAAPEKVDDGFGGSSTLLRL